MIRRAALPFLMTLCLSLGAFPGTAPAQTQLPPGLQPEEAQRPTARAAPAALPGLQGLSRAPVVPPSVPPAAMNPTDALFDAITRGDLAAARDAVRRGANLDATNALGLRPLDAAVDRARPDIAFFLLSLRGPVETTPTGPITARPGATPPTRGAPPPARVARPAPARTPASVPSLPIRTDGGDPVPDRGFLGFDPRR